MAAPAFEYTCERHKDRAISEQVPLGEDLPEQGGGAVDYVEELKKLAREPGRLTATAYHEAGHAVACYALWRPMEWVTIIPGNDYAGRLKPCEKPSGMYSPVGGFRGDTDTYIADRIVLTFAGPVAQAARELLQEGDSSPWDHADLEDYIMAHLYPDTGDGQAIEAGLTMYQGAGRFPFGPVGRTAEEQLEAAQERYSEEGTEKIREYFYNLAVLLMEEYWQAVEAVANALLERETLTAQEVREVVEEVAG
ncbi:MAG TPA: hypothetical protein VFE20_06590 [Thermoleophilia bacterium]|nr:hypothetical protein [Thermoleophilia bacterium]